MENSDSKNNLSPDRENLKNRSEMTQGQLVDPDKETSLEKPDLKDKTDHRQDLINLLEKGNVPTDVIKLIYDVIDHTSNNEEPFERIAQLLTKKMSRRSIMINTARFSKAAIITLLVGSSPKAYEYIRAFYGWNNLPLFNFDNTTNIIPVGDSLNATENLAQYHLCSPGWIPMFVDTINKKYSGSVSYNAPIIHQRHKDFQKPYAVLRPIDTFAVPGMRTDQIVSNILNSLYDSRHNLNKFIQAIKDRKENILFPLSAYGNNVFFEAIFNNIDKDFHLEDPNIVLDLLFQGLDDYEKILKLLHWFFPSAQVMTLTYPPLTQVPGLKDVLHKAGLSEQRVKDETWKMNFEIIRRTLNYGDTFIPLEDVHITSDMWCKTDKVHPGPKGQKLISDVAFSLLVPGHYGKYTDLKNYLDQFKGQI